jgi:hypothetical protein
VDELRRYYAKRLFGLAGLLVVATFALDKVHTRLVKDEAPGWILALSNLLNHHIVLVALLVAGELAIRKWLWRFEKPNLDFHGHWSGTTDYKKRWLGEEGSLPDPATHEVHIKQDCLGVTIEPTEAKAFAQWRSLVCDIVVENGTPAIAYAYEVTYSGEDGFPARARGYEVLRAVKKGRRGRPLRISGDFHQLVSEEKPVFSGLAAFDRTPKNGGTQQP